ncbi:MAG: tetratricopeptide repeat protein [Gemmatimonadetes bacterium]|nr:tetratricopeptide repeat protein [Gemmatimonadota bacterium]MBT7863952.1 tetratricopeptide repeat protein [Gemmatimonadota bacterium]
MAESFAAVRRALRNLSLAMTVLAVVITLISGPDGLDVLSPLRTPLMLASMVGWVAYFGVRSVLSARSQGRGPRETRTVEGPAEELVQKATALSITLQPDHEPGGTAEGLYEEAERLYDSHQYPAAAEKYGAAAEARASLPAYLNWGAALINCSDFSQAEEVTSLGLQMATRMKRKDFRAACLANLAVARNRLGRIDSAEKTCEEALELFRMVGDSHGQADVTLTLGNVHAHRGEYEKAESAYKSALQRFQAVGNDVGQANSRGNMGNLAMHQEQLPQALAHHRAALKLHEQVANPLGRANALANIGNVRFRMGRPKEARQSYDAALEIYRQIEVPLGEASVLGNLGNVLFKSGEHDEALQTYERTIEIHRHIGNVLGHANTLTNLGSLLMRMERRAEALEALHEARRLFESAQAKTRGATAAAALIERLEGADKANGDD